MNKINREVIATSGMDVRGNYLTEKMLQELFNQMPDPYVINQDHDESKPPGGIGNHKKLERLEDGTLAITMDVEFYKENWDSSKHGFSISYAYGRSVSHNEMKKSEICIFYNPREFKETQFVSLLSLSDNEIEIRSVRLEQKSAEVVAIIVISFALDIATGFFHETGKELFRLLKKRLSNLAGQSKRESGLAVVFQFTHFDKLNGHDYEVLVVCSADNIKIILDTPLKLDSAKKFVKEVVGNSIVKKVVVDVMEKSPFWKIRHIIDNYGKKIPLN